MGREALVSSLKYQCFKSGARPTSLGGGRARLSAAAGGLGGGVSESSRPAPLGGFGVGRGSETRHACEVSSRAAFGAP